MKINIITMFLCFNVSISIAKADITTPIKVIDSEKVIENDKININGGSTAISIKGDDAKLTLKDSEITISGINQQNANGIDIAQGSLSINGGKYDYFYDSTILTGHAISVENGGSLYINGADLSITGNADSAKNKFLIQSWDGKEISIKNSQLSSNTGKILFASTTPVTITDSTIYVTNDIAENYINAFESQQNATLSLSGSHVVSDVKNSANSAIFYAPGDGFIDIVSSHLKSNYGQTVLKAVTGHISASDTIINYVTGNDNTNSSIALAVAGYWNYETSMSLTDTTLNAISKDGKFSVAVYLNHTDWDDPGVNDVANTVFTGNNFTLNTDGNIEAFRIKGGGRIDLENSHIYSNSDSNSAFNFLSANDSDVTDHDAIVNLNNTLVLAKEWAIYQFNTDAKFSVNDGSYVKGDSGLAIVAVKNDASTAKDVNLDMQVAGSSQVYGDIRVLDYQGKTASLDMSVDHSYWEGNIVTNKEGSLANIDLSNGGVWKGATEHYQDNQGGVVNITIDGQSSRWIMTDSSIVNNLALNNDSNIQMGEQSAILDGTNSVTLTTESLSGNGNFIMRTALDGIDNYHDLLKVTGDSAAQGAHTLEVNDNKNGSSTVHGDERIKLVETEGGDASFSLKGDDAYIDVGAYKYKLDKGDSALGERDSDWYLHATNDKSNTANNSASILNINYLMNYVENQTLLQRMGELRQTQKEGGDVWGRIYTGTLNSFAANNLTDSKLRYSGFQLGADKNIYSTALWDVYVGVVAGLSKGMTDFKVGDGNTTSYYAGLYGTYKEYNGFYMDLIAKYMYMENKFNTQSGGGYAITGNGHSDGYNIALELGKRFWFGEKPTSESGSWFIEPQGQISYGYQGSATIQASNGLKTKLNDFDSVLGRIGTLLGYSTYDKEDNQVDIYFKIGYVKEYDGDTSYIYNGSDRESYSFAGHWIDGGIGVNAQMSKQHNLYLDINYAKGQHFDQHQVNVGYRFNF